MNAPTPHFGPALTDDDLRAILALQSQNLPGHISREEALAQGFVTVHHEFDVLAEMNEAYGHSIARCGSELAGYALVMETRFRERIPVLVPMFDLLDEILWRGRPLAGWRYFVMGQVCVAKAYRGQGVFPGLYADLCRRLAPHFDLVVTEISARNPRSLRAHEKVGFSVVHRYVAEGENWVVVAKPLTDGA